MVRMQDTKNTGVDLSRGVMLFCVYLTPGNTLGVKNPLFFGILSYIHI